MSKDKPFTDHIIGLENLKQAERVEIDRIISGVRSSSQELPGVLVGAIRGAEAWDLRPIMLQHVPKKGTLAMVRASQPNIKPTTNELEHLRKLPPGASYLSCGVFDSQFWIRRIFYPMTLASPEFSMSSTSPLRIARKIIEGLKGLHELGIVHGHICPENVAIDGEEAILIDIGIRSLGQNKTITDDILGLAVVLKRVMGTQLSDDHKTVIAKMQSDDPSERPDIATIERVFLPPFAKEAGKILVGAEPGHVRTGRLLGQGTVVSAPQSQSTYERPPEKHPIPSGESSQVSEGRAERIEERVKEVTSNLSSPLPKIDQKRSALLILVIPLLLIAAYLYWTRQSGQEEKYVTLWDSQNVQDAKGVAEAAVLQDDSAAQAVIIENAFSSQPRGGYRAGLIRMAFRPLWSDNLSASDRAIAFSLALSALSPALPENLPPLANAHPGIIVAVIGDLSLKASEGKFSNIPINAVTSLPAPYGLAFSELEKLKVQNMGDLSSRALSRLVSGNANGETLDAWLNGSDQGAQASTRFLIALSFADQIPELVQVLAETVRLRNDTLGARFGWFQEEKIANWEKLALKDKLYLVGGLLPDVSLNFEQLADLLLFPAPTVQNSAAKSLKKGLVSQKEGPTLDFLITPANRLTRFQMVSLLVALKMEGEEAYPLIARWFETNPNPESVLKVLVARKAVNVTDAWNLEAARYLSTHDFETSIEELSALAIHPEALARALAYSRLDPNDPAQAKILQAGAKREPSQKMRDEIIKKLQGVALE